MQKLQTYLKSIFQRKDTSGLSIFGRGHHFDWKFLLTMFFIVLLVTLGFSVNTYLGVRSGELFKVPEASIAPTALINRKGLDSVIHYFSVKSEHLKALQTQKPVLVDPSK